VPGGKGTLPHGGRSDQGARSARVIAVVYCHVQNHRQLKRVSEGIDVAGLLEAFDNNRSLLAQIINVFLADLPAKIDRLHTAAAAGDAGDVFTAIHTIRGAVGMLSRGNAYEAALALERDARLGAMGDILARSVEIEYELTRLASALGAALAELRHE
jgi:HPt (histidine-containing phosphotransfer) domain-containing protein